MANKTYSMYQNRPLYADWLVLSAHISASARTHRLTQRRSSLRSEASSQHCFYCLLSLAHVILMCRLTCLFHQLLSVPRHWLRRLVKRNKAKDKSSLNWEMFTNSRYRVECELEREQLLQLLKLLLHTSDTFKCFRKATNFDNNNFWLFSVEKYLLFPVNRTQCHRLHPISDDNRGCGATLTGNSCSFRYASSGHRCTLPILWPHVRPHTGHDSLRLYCFRNVFGLHRQPPFYESPTISVYYKVVHFGSTLAVRTISTFLLSRTLSFLLSNGLGAIGSGTTFGRWKALVWKWQNAIFNFFNLFLIFQNFFFCHVNYAFRIH